MATTSQGMAISATSVTPVTMEASPANASRAKSAASSPASSFFENIGTKAVLKAPSAKKRRNMLGREKAIRKASATGPAPSWAAIRMSRTKPSTRLASVQTPTVRKPAISRIGFKGWSCSAPVFPGFPRNPAPLQAGPGAFCPGVAGDPRARQQNYIILLSPAGPK